MNGINDLITIDLLPNLLFAVSDITGYSYVSEEFPKRDS